MRKVSAVLDFLHFSSFQQIQRRMKKPVQGSSVQVSGISSMTAAHFTMGKHHLCLLTSAACSELASFPFLSAAQRQDKVLHHPELVGSMGCKRAGGMIVVRVCV